MTQNLRVMGKAEGFGFQQTKITAERLKEAERLWARFETFTPKSKP